MKAHFYVDLQEIYLIEGANAQSSLHYVIVIEQSISAARSNSEMKSLGTLPLRVHPYLPYKNGGPLLGKSPASLSLS